MHGFTPVRRLPLCLVDGMASGSADAQEVGLRHGDGTVRQVARRTLCDIRQERVLQEHDCLRPERHSGKGDAP